MDETEDNEDDLVRSVALQNARAILLARQRAEHELLEAKETLRIILASGRRAPTSSRGAERVVDPILAPVKDAPGLVLLVAATGADVTERRRMEDSLREEDRKKDEFIAMLAHELRNPLAPPRNGLRVMRLAAGDADTIARARGMMDRQLGHMVRIIVDLLDVSRISQNKMELRRSRPRLADVIGTAVETDRPVIEAAVAPAGHLAPRSRSSSTPT